jgi:hypothetical protein
MMRCATVDVKSQSDYEYIHFRIEKTAPLCDESIFKLERRKWECARTPTSLVKDWELRYERTRKQNSFSKTCQVLMKQWTNLFPHSLPLLRLIPAFIYNAKIFSLHWH